MDRNSFFDFFDWAVERLGLDRLRDPIVAYFEHLIGRGEQSICEDDEPSSVSGVIGFGDDIEMEVTP